MVGLTSSVHGSSASKIPLRPHLSTDGAVFGHARLRRAGSTPEGRRGAPPRGPPRCPPSAPASPGAAAPGAAGRIPLVTGPVVPGARAAPRPWGAAGAAGGRSAPRRRNRNRINVR